MNRTYTESDVSWNWKNIMKTHEEKLQNMSSLCSWRAFSLRNSIEATVKYANWDITHDPKDLIKCTFCIFHCALSYQENTFRKLSKVVNSILNSNLPFYFSIKLKGQFLQVLKNFL